MLDFLALAQQCAPTVAPQTMAAVVHVESGFNPYAIGVVGGRLARQPASLEEAVATAQSLEANGWNFSVGVAQVNRYNLPKYSLSYTQAFDACENVRVGSKILEDCYGRAIAKMPGKEQEALQAAFSCYYSGNFKRGFRPDRAGDPSYVQKVLASADVTPKAIPVVPTIKGTKTAEPSAVAPAAAPIPASAPTAPPPELAPLDHASVLVDLSPASAAQEGAGEAAAPSSQPPSSSDEGDTPVPLKAERVTDAPASAAKADTRDVTVF